METSPPRLRGSRTSSGGYDYLPIGIKPESKYEKFRQAPRAIPIYNGTFYKGRDIALFALLMRRDKWHNRQIMPVVNPRGLPSDISEATLAFYQAERCWRNETWLSLKEADPDTNSAWDEWYHALPQSYRYMISSFVCHRRGDIFVFRVSTT